MHPETKRTQMLLLGISVVCFFTGAWLLASGLHEKPANLGHHSHPGNGAQRQLPDGARAQQPKSPAWTYPDGATTLFPNYRVVALYGSPNAPTLGALGEQPIGESVKRARDLVTNYQSFSDEKIMPAFEIITTVATATPTENGDYSREVDPASIQPWIDAARQAGLYVVLDLQPGRSDFLTQAKQYESLLAQPNVGLALDPEWRLGSDQVPLVQIGSVSADEINATLAWLAQVAKNHKDPQKLVVLHEFRLSMIQNRDQLDTSRKELAYVIQMDGQGAQNVKQDTWHSVTQNPPANTYFGWKNFYHKDSPMLSPEETMQISPKPWYVSYQ